MTPLPMTTSSAPLNRTMKGVTSAYVVSGLIHLVRPQVFERIMPTPLPAKRELVYLSGIAELGCAVGLLRPSSRAVAGWASAALLVAVWPANVQMALDLSRRARHAPGAPQPKLTKPTKQQLAQVAGWVRVAGQIPLIRASIRQAQAQASGRRG